MRKQQLDPAHSDAGIPAAVQKFELFVDPLDPMLVNERGRLKQTHGNGRGRLAAGTPRLLKPEDLADRALAQLPEMETHAPDLGRQAFKYAKGLTSILTAMRGSAPAGRADSDVANHLGADRGDLLLSCLETLLNNEEALKASSATRHPDCWCFQLPCRCMAGVQNMSFKNEEEVMLGPSHVFRVGRRAEVTAMNPVTIHLDSRQATHKDMPTAARVEAYSSSSDAAPILDGPVGFYQIFKAALMAVNLRGWPEPWKKVHTCLFLLLNAQCGQVMKLVDTFAPAAPLSSWNLPKHVKDKLPRRCLHDPMECWITDGRKDVAPCDGCSLCR